MLGLSGEVPVFDDLAVIAFVSDIIRGGEQFVTVEDSMGMVHASRGRLDPASPRLLSEPAIVCRLARRVLGERSATPWEEFEKDYATIRDRIAPHMLLMELVRRRAEEFDVLHFHMDYYSFSLFKRQDTPFVTTMAGLLARLPEPT